MEGETNTGSPSKSSREEVDDSLFNTDRRTSFGFDTFLGGRRPSGFADLEEVMHRRGSMDLVDAAIIDLTRRRLSMAMGMSSDSLSGGMGDPFMSGMGMGGLGGMNSMVMSSMTGGMQSANAVNSASSTAVNDFNARQSQLQLQQRELERRQRELELQRQQLLAAMEERRRVMQQMQSKIPDCSRGNVGNDLVASNDGVQSAFAQRNSLLGNLGGGFGSNGLGVGYGSSGLGGGLGSYGSAMAGSARGAGGSGGNDWYVCTICNSKAFANKEEAFAHESICMQTNFGHRNSGMFDARRGSLDLLGALAGTTPTMGNNFSREPGQTKSSDPQRSMSSGPFTMMDKPLPLAMPPDKDWLTPLHCFVRQHCVEVFTATEDDVSTPSKGKRKPITVGQIGIRCPHCHVEDAAKSRERGSVYYPTSIASIYNATMNLLQRHLHNCSSVPIEIMQRYETLKSDDARSGTSKKYWMESALSLGLVDTANGIRFSALPPPPLPSLTPQQRSGDDFTAARGNDDDFFNSSSNALMNLSQRAPTEDSMDGDEESNKNVLSPKSSAQRSAAAVNAAVKNEKDGHIPVAEQSLANSAPLVTPDDEPYATGFSFHLLSQMQPCIFTEADRLGKRKGLPPGFPGLACRHCFGGYGSGRFFPSSIKTLSDTSKTLNVLHNHMQRCRKCPSEIRETLDKLRKTHDEERAKMKFGSQKAFFARIWDRLHSNDPTVSNKRKFEQPSRKNIGILSPAGSASARATNFQSAAAFQQPFMGGTSTFGAMGGSSGLSPGSGRAGFIGGSTSMGMPYDSIAMQYAVDEMRKRQKLDPDRHSAV